MSEIKKAIENLKHIQTTEKQYGRLWNMCEVSIKALEKQIPMKVHHFLDYDTFITTCCDYDVTNEDYDYCPNCGQLLGDVEEVEG